MLGFHMLENIAHAMFQCKIPHFGAPCGQIGIAAGDGVKNSVGQRRSIVRDIWQQRQKSNVRAAAVFHQFRGVDQIQEGHAFGHAAHFNGLRDGVFTAHDSAQKDQMIIFRQPCQGLYALNGSAAWIHIVGIQKHFVVWAQPMANAGNRRCCLKRSTAAGCAVGRHAAIPDQSDVVIAAKLSQDIDLALGCCNCPVCPIQNIDKHICKQIAADVV